MTNIEYLLRSVRESEHMSGWQDAFSKMREDITKEFSERGIGSEKSSDEMEDTFEK